MNITMNIIDLEKKWSQAQPFSHVVIDNFLPQDIAEKVAVIVKKYPQAASYTPSPIL